MSSPTEPPTSDDGYKGDPDEPIESEGGSKTLGAAIGLAMEGPVGVVNALVGEQGLEPPEWDEAAAERMQDSGIGSEDDAEHYEQGVRQAAGAVWNAAGAAAGAVWNAVKPEGDKPISASDKGDDSSGSPTSSPTPGGGPGGVSGGGPGGQSSSSGGGPGGQSNSSGGGPGGQSSSSGGGPGGQLSSSGGGPGGQ